LQTLASDGRVAQDESPSLPIVAHREA